MNFSVVIPAYNCEKTIESTIKSILNVQIDEMEIIIIDDGSTDGTSEKCKHIVEKNSKVRYFYQENAGVSKARNFGVSQAEGYYILFWDSDDLAESSLLRKCMMKANEMNVDMLIFGMEYQRVFHQKTIQVDFMRCKEEELIKKSDFAERLAELFDINYLSSGCNKILKRELCLRTRFNPAKNTFEDLLFVLEYLKNCESIYIMPDLAYIYQIDYLEYKKSRVKRIKDMNEYMCDFQVAILDLEKQLRANLIVMRTKIGIVYEWILCNRLELSSYRELKQLNKNNMRMIIFGKPYYVKLRINRWFFENRLFTIRVFCLLRRMKKVIDARLKYCYS